MQMLLLRSPPGLFFLVSGVAALLKKEKSNGWSYKLCDLTEWDASHHSNLWTTALISNTAPEHELTHDNTHEHTQD